MTDYSELKKRLVEKHYAFDGYQREGLSNINRDGPAALAAIEELEERVRVLERALQHASSPIAAVAITMTLVNLPLAFSKTLSGSMGSGGEFGNLTTFSVTYSTLT